MGGVGKFHGRVIGLVFGSKKHTAYHDRCFSWSAPASAGWGPRTNPSSRALGRAIRLSVSFSLANTLCVAATRSAVMLPPSFRALCFSLIAALLVPAVHSHAQAPAAQRLFPNLENNIERPLRYHVEGEDFLIENGPEFFNRPLYGGNTAFRVDGGDKPEWVLYLPGRGGNLRLGLRTAAGAKWLHAAESVTMRYRPGELLYEIRDPLLGSSGVMQLAVVSTFRNEGLILRARGDSFAQPVELLWAYGGVNGQRGSRDGDIGTERVPISEWFQLKPEFCQGNTFELTPTGFRLTAKAATLSGIIPVGATLGLADAHHWNDLPALLASTSQEPAPESVVVGRVSLQAGQTIFLGLEREPKTTDDTGELGTYLEVKGEKPDPHATPPRAIAAEKFTRDALATIFDESEKHFAELRRHVAVETPDPFINAAVGALNVAADAVWDEPQGAIMHGAIAWRTRLLGWRGPYLLDALGWPERAQRHFTSWARQQNTSPIPEKIPPADEASNLARNETGLHSNGDLSKSHYDMNLVYIDALFRHLRWTGDVEFARQLWPVIERHLAWERRLFRREYGPEKLPLYEAYAAIWASDDLQYNGGGATHSSAYNYWHNKMAAEIAPRVGADPTPYAKEAELIARAMRTFLWMPERGMFGEYKDLLGLQRVHPSAAVWTFYHTLDCELTTPAEAAQMAAYVDREIPHLPVRGPQVPSGLYTVATSNWMPYLWSINNVVMGESIHTALGLWQAGARDDAFRLLKGSLLASMNLGICPGNVGSMNYLDVYRRESQRDFADPNGVTSRALIEGLFGVRPDAISGLLTLAPGFPSDWDHATLRHPNIGLSMQRRGNEETYRVEQRFARPQRVRWVLPQRTESPVLKVDGVTKPWIRDEVSHTLAIETPAAVAGEIVVLWQGQPIASRATATAVPGQSPAVEKTPPTGPNSFRSEAVDLAGVFNDRVTKIFSHEYRSPRSPFVSLAVPKQGIGAWAGDVNATAEIDDTGLRAVAAKNGGRFPLESGVQFTLPTDALVANVAFVSQWDNFPREAVVPLAGRAQAIVLLMAGSTNPMQSRIDNGEVVVAYTDGFTERLALENPTTWWPIEQDYFVDDFQFRRPEPLPLRVDLKTGKVRRLSLDTFKGKGGRIPGGAATVLELRLNPAKELKSLTVRALSNEVVIGLMAATLMR